VRQEAVSHKRKRKRERVAGCKRKAMVSAEAVMSFLPLSSLLPPSAETEAEVCAIKERAGRMQQRHRPFLLRQAVARGARGRQCFEEADR